MIGGGGVCCGGWLFRDDDDVGLPNIVAIRMEPILYSNYGLIYVDGLMVRCETWLWFRLDPPPLLVLLSERVVFVVVVVVVVVRDIMQCKSRIFF